ncbi:hypothetical protein ACFXTO_030541 [Malus domestica]
MGNGYSPSPDSTSSSPLSLTPSAKLDSFLNAFWGLTPKVMVITEQDSNHNGSTLMERLLESLYLYAALFDCLESTMLRTSLERLKAKRMLQSYGCDGYRMREENGCVLISRQDRPLFSMSAWRCRK